jgi:two-component system, sensor histidine kinase FlrB
MTSLPMSTCWPEPVPNAPLEGVIGGVIEANFGNLNLGANIGATNITKNIEDEQFLLRAFRTFSQAAASLERSYGMLRGEVERLRQELEQSNSDLARSLEENRGMREHLNRILEGLPCGVLVISNDGKISRANPEALHLLGGDQSECPAVPGFLSELPPVLQQFLEYVRQKTGEHELNLPGVNSARWLAARHAWIANAEAGSSVFILRDVSERKRLEETQAKLRREQALAEISTVLAHEIRNPLGSMELFAGLLAESQLDGESRDWVERVQAGLRTLVATVNNVLHFHSLPEPERVPVDLGHLLDWARDFFAPLARQSGVTLSLQNRATGVIFPADRHRLEQVLLNLVLNALRAMPGGGWIELSGSTVEDGRAVLLAVADTGPGISLEHLSSIFEAGFSTRAGSPGLGLAVCRKIVEQHGGTISATSLPGRGAKFTLAFPLSSNFHISKPAGAITE